MRANFPRIELDHERSRFLHRAIAARTPRPRLDHRRRPRHAALARLLLVQPGAHAPAEGQARRRGRAPAHRGRDSRGGRCVRAPRRAHHHPRQRHRQLRPDDAARGRRGARHDGLQRLPVGAARRGARAGRHPPGRAREADQTQRPGDALRALDLPQRNAGRALRRRLRRRGLHQLRAAGRAGQRDRHPRDDHRGRAASVRAARPRRHAHAPPVGHQRPRAGAGDRAGAGASVARDAGQFSTASRTR
jgi:hypothetical protein